MFATDNKLDSTISRRAAAARGSVESPIEREIAARLAAECALRECEERLRLHREQLVRANKMTSLGFLVSGVAHEINNPANYISMSAPLLRRAWESVMPFINNSRGGDGGDILVGGMNFQEFARNLDRLMEGIEEGARRIKRIVADLKDYVHQSPGDLCRVIDLNTVVQTTVNIMGAAIKKRTKRFSLTLHESPLSVKGNPQRLEQVVINLVQNACDALTAPEQSLSVSVERCDAPFVAVVVRDEGCGIRPEDLPKIADPFFTTKREKGGTGLGLSVSAGIVKDHGGQLKFESAVGKGTTVFMLLPRAGRT